jgi:anti-anti-sigma factor
VWEPLHSAEGSVYRLVPHAEIDLENAEELSLAITQAIKSADSGGVMMDMSRVTFNDSSAIGVLIGGRRYTESQRVPHIVSNSDGQVRRVLDVTGLVHLLEGGGLQRPQEQGA